MVSPQSPKQVPPAGDASGGSYRIDSMRLLLALALCAAVIVVALLLSR